MVHLTRRPSSSRIHPDPQLLQAAADSDPIGYETLRRMATVTHYNDWIYQEIHPVVGQRLLEIGCGIGNMTEYFVDRELLVAIDLLSVSVQLTRHRHLHNPHIIARQGDITDPQIVADLKHHAFDSVICLNVLEHIADHRTALRHIHQLLISGGHLLLFVPAGPYMFGTLDVALGHHRRYERESLRQLILETGFKIERLSYLNLAGVPGWWLNSRLLKRELLPDTQLAWFNRLAPLFIAFERRFRRLWDIPVGQSLLCIACR